MKIELNSEELSCLINNSLIDSRAASKAEGMVLARNEEILDLKDKLRDVESDLKSVLREQVIDKLHPPVMSADNYLRLLAPIFEASVNGRKIDAIKQLRQLTNCGLKEAKDVIEGVYIAPWKANG